MSNSLYLQHIGNRQAEKKYKILAVHISCSIIPRAKQHSYYTACPVAMVYGHWSLE